MAENRHLPRVDLRWLSQPLWAYLPTAMMWDLQRSGFAVVPTGVPAAVRAGLRVGLFCPGQAGTRCLLDEPAVRQVALSLKEELVGAGHLPAGALAIQAIAFDKTAATNWKVAWHQDLMFPFARPATDPGYTLPCRKDGVDFARPPRPVLETLLAVRLHLDACDEANGPLRVVPGSHLTGVIPPATLAGKVEAHGTTTCLAAEGEALLMRPLLLHASSRATEPRHRRVLHLVYHSGEAVAEPWHHAVGEVNLPGGQS